MNRRQFLLFSAAALSAVRGAAATAPALTLPLWSDQPPGGGGPGGEARLSARGALSHIPRPVLTVWQPARATGHGVLVAPAADTSGSRWAVRPGLRRTG